MREYDKLLELYRTNKQKDNRGEYVVYQNQKYYAEHDDGSIHFLKKGANQ